MNEFFSKGFSGPGFSLFSPTHLAAIAGITLLCLSFLFVRRSPNQKLRLALRYSMAGALLINETLWHVWNLATGQWTVKTMLPLHLCSVFVFLSAVMLLRRSRGIYEFAYFLGIAGALQAVLTPDLGIYDFPHFRYFQVFVSHGLIIAAAVYMTVVEGMRPTWKSFGRVLVWSNVYMAFVGVVNALIGSNYLYIAHPPETPSLIDMLGPWPWYLLALEGIGLVMFLLLYLPFALRDLPARGGALVRGDTL